METSITENKDRIGNFTSSNIYRLMTEDKKGGLGKPALTYIEEKNIERRLNRSLETETHTQPMAWGNICERRVFDLLSIEFEHMGNVTKMHPTIDYWAGSCDLIVTGKKICEIKCYQPKNFAQYTDILLQKDVTLLREERPEEYWQLVSNAIINGVNAAEAISYMPYRSELDAIRDLANNWEGEDQWKYRFIPEKTDAWLAWVPDGGYYKNLNRFEFEIPKEDIDLLTERVKLAGAMLIKRSA